LTVAKAFPFATKPDKEQGSSMEWTKIPVYSALIGAVLGIINSAVLFFGKWPIAFFEPTGSNALRLRIVNPSDRPIQISRLYVLPHKAAHTMNLSSSSDGVNSPYRWLQFKRNKLFYDFIMPKSGIAYTISNINTDDMAVFIFCWHRNRVINIPTTY
jgi:hypothetical protein